MELMTFKNGETSTSAETFSAFQMNIKNAFKINETADLIPNPAAEVTLSNITLQKDESNNVVLTVMAERNRAFGVEEDVIIGFVPDRIQTKRGFRIRRCKSRETKTDMRTLLSLVKTEELL